MVDERTAVYLSSLDIGNSQLLNEIEKEEAKIIAAEQPNYWQTDAKFIEVSSSTYQTKTNIRDRDCHWFFCIVYARIWG